MPNRANEWYIIIKIAIAELFGDQEERIRNATANVELYWTKSISESIIDECERTTIIHVRQSHNI